MSDALHLRVNSIRSQNPLGFGGCIFTGKLVNDSADTTPQFYVVKASRALLGNAQIQVGQWWSVNGVPAPYHRRLNGYNVTEWQIDAEQIQLLEIAGEQIIDFMAESEGFQGIGRVKARKLWDTFREDLYRILNDGEVDALARVLTKESAEQVISAWASHGHGQTLQWLHQVGLDGEVAKRVLEFFGNEARQRLEEDPYRLLSFSGKWSHVDRFAIEHFNLGEQDPRRLHASIEEALYRALDDGHTAMPSAVLIKRVESVLKDPDGIRAVREILASGSTNGSYLVSPDGTIQLLGQLVMEREIACAVRSRVLPGPDNALLDVATVDHVLRNFEETNTFPLNAGQRAAVHIAARHRLALIVGGAGVGKTTVLKALYEVYDAADVQLFQVAIAGRAAQRMAEATDRPASTLSSFLARCSRLDLAIPTAVVIDEASMVDVISMSRLCQVLPSHVRLVVVGDNGQLMPVGPGLVLHALLDVPGIPIARLTEVMRFGSVLYAASDSVRNGVMPGLSSDFNGEISFVECGTREIPDVVLRLLDLNPTHTQVLTPRKNSVDGAKNLNEVCQVKYAKHRQPLTIDSVHHRAIIGTGFYLGDPILCTRNLWEHGLQNGSTGILAVIEDRPQPYRNDAGDVLGITIAWADWDDGVRRPIFESMLEDLDLAYAITIHKAQGSQWQRVIVPLTGGRMLDRTLVYTAMTRAQHQVVFVGDLKAVRAAVAAVPKVSERQTGLHRLLAQLS
jgi:exodeoxyribonuclease V alpha subunit